MKEKNTTVLIGDNRYQIHRFSPEVGSFILMQIVSAGFKGQKFSDADIEAAAQFVALLRC